MKTSRAVFLVCLLNSLSCEAACPELNSIDDLKKIHFERSVPKHSLLLLHWFANTVEIDDNNVVSFTFNPNTDFGSHHYGNYDNILDPLPRGYRYYTVGNLNRDTSNELPDYVLNPRMSEFEGTNTDRIIFRVQEQHSGVHTIDRVYITQHDSPTTRYDPNHTYQVSPILLRQTRLFSVVGLILFILIQEDSENKPQPDEREDAQPHFEPDTSNEEEETPSEQNDREELDLVWRNHNTRAHDGSVVPLANDNTDQNVSTLPLTQENRPQPMEREDTLHFEPDTSNEEEETPSEQNDREELERRRRNHNTGAQDGSIVPLPNDNADQNASNALQLTQENRPQPMEREDTLHFEPDTSNEEEETSHLKPSEQNDGEELERRSRNHNTRDQPEQDGVVEPYVNDDTDQNEDIRGDSTNDNSEPRNDSLQDGWLKSIKAYRFWIGFSMMILFIVFHFFRISVFSNISQHPGGVKITGYDANLELFPKAAKACARLYVKKSFGQWRSEFDKSWVGFYKSAQKDTNGYEWWQWQWATEFKRCPNSDLYKDYDIFEFCSETPNAPGLHVRFIHRDSREIARHFGDNI